MKLLVLVPLCASLFFACSSNDVDCPTELAAGKAVQVIPPDSDDHCNFEGILRLSGEDNPDDDTTDMVCEVEGGHCTCSGGTNYGLYRVIITNKETDESITALLDAEAAPTPQCTALHAVEPFAPIGGGMGGMGGGSN